MILSLVYRSSSSSLDEQIRLHKTSTPNSPQALDGYAPVSERQFRKYSAVPKRSRANIRETRARYEAGYDVWEREAGCEVRRRGRGVRLAGRNIGVINNSNRDNNSA